MKAKPPLGYEQSAITECPTYRYSPIVPRDRWKVPSQSSWQLCRTSGVSSTVLNWIWVGRVLASCIAPCVLSSHQTLNTDYIQRKVTLTMYVTPLDLVSVNTKLIETMTTNKMDWGQSQLLSTLVAVLLVKVLRLSFHKSNILTHRVDPFRHLLHTILLDLAFLV
jgi:hypothetical protein